jgi:hypothetical protein
MSEVAAGRGTPAAPSPGLVLGLVPATPSDARGSGGRGRGSRYGYRSGRGGPGRGNGAVVRSAVIFKGNTEDMNGHVFQCHNEASDKQ